MHYVNRNKFIGYIIIAIFISILFSIYNNKVYGDTLDNGRQNYYDVQIFQDDQKFDMPKNVSSYFFNIPDRAELNDDCYVDLHYKISDTLINNLSNIIISINGTPIETKWIDNIKQSSLDWWRVKIPKDRLKAGAINEIAIQSNQRSIEGDCADIDNPSNWITLYKDSKIHLSVKSIPAPLLQNFYQFYFENFLDKKTLSSEFILPKIQDKNSIESLLKVSSSIGDLYPDRSAINYEVNDNINPKNNDKDKVIIGKVSDILNNNLKAILPKENLKENQGFLSIADSTKENPYYKTVITGISDNGLKKAVDFISNNNLLNKIDNNSLVIDSQVENKYTGFSQNENGNYRLSDWGYSDINLAGAFHQKTTFSLVQPNGLQSGSGSYINIKFKHSKLLISDRSLLTIYINDKVIDSEKLSSSNADGGNLKVNIPESALKQPVIKVDIECYNYIGKIDCSKDYYDSAWTVITADSEVHLVPGKIGAPPNLEKFPFFTKVTDSKLPVPVIVLPKEIDDTYLEVASIIAARAGQNSNQAFDWNIVKGDENLTKAQKENDMVIIGSFNNIKIPDKIKDELPIVPLGNNKFTIKDDVQLVPETLKNKIIFQVIRSPWNFYKRVYVITYDNNDNLNSLKDFLSDTNYLWNMGKQVSIINNSKEVHNISASIDENDKVPITPQSVITLIENKTGLPWWILMVLLILLIIGIISIIRLRKLKNQFKNAVDKIRKEEGFYTDKQEFQEENIKNNEDSEQENNKDLEKGNESTNNIDSSDSFEKEINIHNVNYNDYENDDDKFEDDHTSHNNHINLDEEDKVDEKHINASEKRIDYGNDPKYEEIRKSRKARRGRKKNRRWFFK